MKLLLLLFCLPSFCGAQPTPSTQTVHPKPRISLEIGSVSVWLGMPKSEALHALKDAGLTNAPDAGGLYMVVGSGSMASVSFTNGKLSFADREWVSEDKNDVDAMLGALEALSSRGVSNCNIQHAPITSPNQRANRIFINCGERGVMLMRGSFQNLGIVNSVTERIGHFTPET
jgi:hypothetical protein